jgi:Kef-type K+ transport system membrane component KefB
MAQVTIADVVTILSVPIVLQPGRVTHAVLGGALVGVGAVAIFVAARQLRGHQWVRHMRELSKQRHWALDLRVSLLVLFALAWIAQKSGTSVLIAGFGTGLMVALVGGPKRLSTQLRGVAEGFFIPLYFVVLGARLDLHGLFDRPALLELTAALALLNVVVHLLATTIMRKPVSSALAASAQLGVPAAIASLGLAEHVLSNGVATAIIAAAMISLVVCTLGVQRLIALQLAGAPVVEPATTASPTASA